jgi:hypothetical protein
VNVGATSQLAYSSANATSVSITGSDGERFSGIAASGSVTVHPTNASNVYTLVLSGPGGSNASAATATVVIAAPSGTFTAKPTSIPAANTPATVTLVWTSANATVATLDGVAVPTSSSGYNVTILLSHTYTLVLSGVGGQTSFYETVTVTNTQKGCKTNCGTP